MGNNCAIDFMRITIQNICLNTDVHEVPPTRRLPYPIDISIPTSIENYNAWIKCRERNNITTINRNMINYTYMYESNVYFRLQMKPVAHVAFLIANCLITGNVLWLQYQYLAVLKNKPTFTSVQTNKYWTNFRFINLNKFEVEI